VRKIKDIMGKIEDLEIQSDIMRDSFLSLVYVQEETNAALKTLCIYLGIDYTELSKSFVGNLKYIEIGDIDKTGFLAKLIKLTKADEYVLIEEETEPKTKLVKKSK